MNKYCFMCVSRVSLNCYYPHDDTNEVQYQCADCGTFYKECERCHGTGGVLRDKEDGLFTCPDCLGGLVVDVER
jgi:hypothetical protein